MNIIKIMIIILSIMSCKKENNKDDNLSLQRQDYNGNEIKLEGFYYVEKENSEGVYYQRYCFFKNGIIRDLGSNKQLNNENLLSGSSKTDWGVFQISNNEIKFERWYPSSGGPLKAYVRSGEILNDTTFKITESYRMLDGDKTEVRERNELYHFKALSSKPDSTNKFIE